MHFIKQLQLETSKIYCNWTTHCNIVGNTISFVISRNTVKNLHLCNSHTFTQYPQDSLENYICVCNYCKNVFLATNLVAERDSESTVIVSVFVRQSTLS